MIPGLRSAHPGMTRRDLSSRPMVLIFSSADTRSHSRDMLLPEFCNQLRPKNVRGAGMPGVRWHPWLGKKSTGSRHRFTGINRHSLRDGFTVSFELSLVIGLSVTIIPASFSFSRLDASVETSGPHASPSASLAVRPRDQARDDVAQRPPHPVPTFVTMANAPLRDGTAPSRPVIAPKRKAENFSREGWTPRIRCNVWAFLPISARPEGPKPRARQRPTTNHLAPRHV